MANMRQYEKDERHNLRGIVEMMNHLHAVMGGRDRRPERVALVKCMTILQKEIDREVAPAPPPWPQGGGFPARDLGPFAKLLEGKK